MSEQGIGYPAKIPEYHEKSGLLKMASVAEIAGFVIALISLPWYLWISGPNISIGIVLLIVLTISLLGAAIAYLGQVGHDGPTRKNINWLKLIALHDKAIKLHIGTESRHRYGVSMDFVLSEIRTLYLVAVAHNHDKLAEALLQDHNRLFEERETHVGDELDNEYEESVRTMVLMRSARKLK